MKICSKCGIQKEFSEFCKNKANKDQLNNICRDCSKLKFKKWREQNLDYEKERFKNYYENKLDYFLKKNEKWKAANREKYLKHKRDSYERHKEEILKKQKNYYYENFEKINKRNKEWDLKNKEKMKKYYQDFWRKNKDLYYSRNAKRRAMKIQAFVFWADIDKIEALYTEAQKLSIETGILHHVDHIIPLNHPKVCGLHNEFNLQILTAQENLSKSNKFTPG
jgi:hypothetical protein